MGRPIVAIKRATNTPEQSLGAVVTELRTEKKWSQRDLGDQIGHTEYYVSRIEKGTQSAPLDVIVKIAQAFGLRGSQLLAKAEKLLGKEE
jgi:transcriptional regulator with XRE-family HTH domain